MTPGKDLNSNQPKNTPAKTEVFQTPWQTNFLGTKEKVVLIRDRTSSLVTAQVVSQNIFRRLFAQDKKFTIEKETKFTNISEDNFKKEKLELQKLLAKHASVNDMLQQIEKDLKKPSSSTLPPATPTPVPTVTPAPMNNPSNTQDETTDNGRSSNDSPSTQSEPEKPEEIQIPTLSPEEIEMRQTTVQALRDELETLMNKIRKQEIKPHFNSYERLKKCANAIKEAVYSTFSTFDQLNIDAENPSVSLLDLKKNANALKALNTKWFNDLATIKQTFVEGLSLKEEIDRLSSQIQSFSTGIQSQWEEFIEELEEQSVSNLASGLDVHMVRQKLSRAVAKICQQCKDETTQKSETSLECLKQHLDATAPVFEEKEKHQAHSAFREHILAARQKAWESLNEAKHLAGNDLEKIAAWQQDAAKELAIDEGMAQMLTILPVEEGYLGKLYSIVTSPLSALSNPLKAILPASFFAHQSSLLAEKAFLDEASAVYMDHALDKINGSITRLLETIAASDEKNPLIERHKNLVGSPALLKSNLDAFIDDLIDFSRLAAKIENDTFNRETIYELSANLGRQKEALTVLLNSREHHSHAFIKKAREEYATAFADSTHPAVLETAQAVAKQLFPEEVSDIDIKAVSDAWQNHRLAAAAPLKTLKTLEAFGRLQKEYLLIAENRRMEIGQLTGEEKATALSHLEALEKTIHSLDSISADGPVDASMLADYHNRLVQANNLFAPLLTTENRKKELRAALNKEIDNFTAELDTHDSSLAEIERHLSVQLKDAQELLKKTRQDVLKLKNKGPIPSTYMNYAPSMALGSIYYYGRSLLSFEEINVNDLSLSDLAIYIENTKAEIATHKATIARSSLAECQTALKAYREESKKLDAHIKSLTSAASKRSSFGMVDQSPIPSGIDASDEPKLQFHNAADTETKQKAIQDKQKLAITEQPNLKSILKRLTADEQALKKLMDQSKKTTTLSLLLQIEKLGSHPAQQKLAKLAFIETLTTKMAAHANAMTSTANVLKNLPRIHEEAVRLMDKTKQDLSAKLGYAHSAIKSHAELWEPVRKDGSDSFSTKKNLPVESLSVSDLHSYSEMIDLAIKTGSDHMNLIKTTYAKADAASKKYQMKVYEAKNTIKALDNKDQLISKNKLEYILGDVEKTKENYSGSAAVASEGWFSSLTSFLSAESSAQSKPAVIKLLDDYKKNIGESIARIDAAMNQIAAAGEMSIPQQLNISPNSQTTEQLRERFNSKIEPLIKSLRESLEKYKKNGTLEKIYGRYVEVDPPSPLFLEIKRAIDEKLMELDHFEQGYQSDGMLSSFFSTSLSELSADQMEKYSNKLSRFESMFEQDLDDKFLIITLRNTQVRYLNMKNDHVKAHAAKLRKHGHFTTAHDFELAIDKIEKEEAKLEKMVTSSGQLKNLDKDLKKFYGEMLEAIQTHGAPDKPLTYDEQVQQLLNDKNTLSSRYNFFGYSQDASKRIPKIESDIITLKSKIISKVESGYQDHQQDLKNLVTELDDLFFKYDIRLCSKSSALQAIDAELYKFSYSQSKFAVTDNTLSSFFYTPKRIEDMSVEDIAQLKPQKKYKTLIESSIKSIIDSSFDYPIIRTAHNEYIKWLESAEKTLLKLKNAGQIVHAEDFEAELERTKAEYDRVRKQPIKNDTDLRNLGNKLDEFWSTLKTAEATANSQVAYTAIEQLSMRPDSPFKEDLKKHLVKGIQSNISEKKSVIKKSLKTLDKLVRELGLPAAWRETIANKLEQSRSEIEKSGNSLPVEVTGWLINSASNHTLGELSVDQLAIVQQEVDKKVAVLNTVLDGHYLQSISDQFDDYTIQLAKVQTQKMKWNSEYQVGSAKKLEAMVAEKKKELEAHFRSPGNDLPKKMEDLQKLLRKLTNELSRETSVITKDKPETIALLMQNEELTPIEYQKLRIALKKDLEKKLLTQQTALGDYMKKIGTMNELIRQKSADSVTFPDAWKLLVEDKIRFKQTQLKDCVKGLPILDKDNNLSWKPFNDLTRKEYLQYETLIHRHIKKENDTKSNPISTLGVLEQVLKLESIEKYLKIYLQEIKLLENTIKQPGINKEKETNLKAILESNKKLVSSAFNELKYPSDAAFLDYALYQSQASLLRANQENNRNYPNLLDPWARIQKHEDSKKDGAPEDTPFSKIIKDGFNISYAPKHFSMNGDFQLEINSFETNIDDAVTHLEDCRDQFNKAANVVLAQNAGNIPASSQPLIDFITITIPQATIEYEELKKGVPIKNKQGVNTFVETNDIKTFDQVLAYRNHIRSTVGKFLNAVQGLHKDNAFYWIEQLAETEKTLYPALPSPDDDKVSEDAINKFSKKKTGKEHTGKEHVVNPIYTGPEIIDLDDEKSVINPPIIIIADSINTTTTNSSSAAIVTSTTSTTSTNGWTGTTVSNAKAETTGATTTNSVQQQESLDNVSLEIINLCNAAAKIVNAPQGNSLHLTSEIVENWRNQHTLIFSSIKSVEDIETAEKQLKTLLETCNNATTSGLAVSLQKVDIIKSIDDTSKVFKEELKFIEDEFEVNFAYINTVVVPEIDALKTTYKIPGYYSTKKDVSSLSQDELSYYNEHVEETLNAIKKNTGITQAKKAAFEFHREAAKIEEAIRHLKRDNKYTQAEQLHTTLKTARDQLKTLARNEQASPSLTALTAKIESATKQLQEKLVGIGKNGKVAADLSVQLRNMGEKNEVFTELKAKIIEKLQNSSDEIAAICTESTNLLEQIQNNDPLGQKFGVLLRNTLKNKLKEHADAVKDYRTIELSGGMFHTEVISIDDLTKNELLSHESKIKSAFKTAKEKADAIHKAILAFNKVETDFQNKIREIENSLKTMEPTQYFNLDKIRKYEAGYNLCKEHLIKVATNPSGNVQKFMEAAMKFESEQLKFEKMLEEMKKAEPLGPLKQLQKSAEEVGVLTPESIQAIHEIIRKWVSTRVDKAVNKLIEYKKEADILPLQIQSKMVNIIDNRIAKLKEFNKDDISSLSLKNIQDWIKPIQATCKNAVSDLEKELQLKKNSPFYVQYNTLQKEAKQGVVELRYSKHFALAADLQTAIDTANAENEVLVSKLDELDFKGFWTGFLKTYSNLVSKVASASAQSYTDNRSVD